MVLSPPKPGSFGLVTVPLKASNATEKMSPTFYDNIGPSRLVWSTKASTADDSEALFFSEVLQKASRQLGHFLSPNFTSSCETAVVPGMESYNIPAALLLVTIVFFT